MPLKGQARTDYMREYMRRRRGAAKKLDGAIEALGLAAARARIAELEAQIRDMEATFQEFLQNQHIPSDLRRAVLSFLHPDQFADPARKRKAEKTFREFNQYFSKRAP
jgi:hypothetical protein